MTALPPELQAAIGSLLDQSNVTEKILRQEALALSTDYRSRVFDRALGNKERILGYAAVRMPATFAVVYNVLKMLPAEDITSLMDLGAGLGSVLWAAQHSFPHLAKATMLEQNPAMMEVGKNLASNVPSVGMKQEWINCPMENANFPAADLVTMSYALGEIPANRRFLILKKAFQIAGRFLVIIEPGTPRGFAGIKEVRQYLISLGGHVWAPCTHSNSCPLAEQDWCHFKVQLPRSSLHRSIKNAALGYEVEKYSYIIIAKDKRPEPDNDRRIIKLPRKRTGHVQLDLCGQTGLQQSVYSRKSGHIYKTARHADWGDLLRERDLIPLSRDGENNDDN